MLVGIFDGFTVIIFALASGFFGASFFMLIQLQTRMKESSLSDIREMWKWSFIFLRCLVGIGGALILYFIFQSDLLGGSIWPNLVKLNFDSCCKVGGTSELYVPNKDLSLLIVWSFLAGYSQTLVPSILVTTEARVNQEDS